MKEKGTEDPIKKAGAVMTDFLKHAAGKASDKPKASDKAKSPDSPSKGAGGGGGGGAF